MSQHARPPGWRRGIAGLLPVALAAWVVAGCRSDAEDDGSAADRARSRAAVQDSAQSLLAEAEAALPARAADPVARWQGCAPFSTLAGEHDGLEAAVTHTGAGRFVLVTVRGDCVAAGGRLDGVR